MDLQHAINTAISGATIQIPDNERCIGNFIIDKQINIVGGVGSTILAPQGHSGTDWANPAFEIPPMTGPVVLRKLNITITDTVNNFWDLVRYGGADATSGQTSLDRVPQGLWLDECDIFGRADAGSQRGISANGANFKITKSKVREIHGRGFDTQAICSWNGPGPFLIEDCYLEAAGENVMFGGSPPIIQGLIHSDIIFRRNYCFKPQEWRGKWTVKNIFELKNARNVLVDGCIFDGCWTDAQAARAIQFTPRPSDSGSWALIEDVQFTNNIIRNTGAGVNILGADQPPAPTETRLRRLRIANCVFEIDGAKFGSDGVFLVITNKTEDVTIENCTVLHTGNLISSDYAPNIRFKFRNNISRHNSYGVFGSGQGTGLRTLDFYFPGYEFTGNVIAKEVDAPSNAESLYPSGNHFPASLSAVGFVDLANGNYQLTESSPYKGAGADITALKAAQGGLVVTPLPAPQPLPQPEPTPTPTPTPTPVPAPEPSKIPSPDGTKARTIIDNDGAEWTIGSVEGFGPTLRDGVRMGNGTGSGYKFVSREVYTLGTDGWYKWSGSWASVGTTEPGATEPTPAPDPTPEPTPTPTPAPVACAISAPASVNIPRNGSGVITVTLTNLTGPTTVNAIGSSGQVTINPLSKTVNPTSATIQFGVKVKQQSRTISFDSPCGKVSVRVNVV